MSGPGAAARRLDLGGGVRITALCDGRLRVDGGAMFGTVPRRRWSRLVPPDADNKVPLALNAFLVETPSRRILLETGMGDIVGPKYLAFYGLRRERTLVEDLAGLGLRPSDVHIVVNSHLHFDHCGGNTARGADGRIAPVFPAARYVVQAGEWEDALNPVGRDKPSYFPRFLRPLAEAGVLDLPDGDAEIVPGVEVVVVPGHTRRHQGVKVSAGGRTFFFAGDAIPTSHHVGLDAIMSYDLYPVETYESKERLAADAAAGEWVVGFGHDVDRPFGRIGKSSRGPVFMPLE